MKDKLQKLLEISMNDRIILNILNFKARPNRVNLHWAPICEKKYGTLVVKSDSPKQNLGDWLALPIFEYMTKRCGVDPDKKISRTKHLYTIGSLILLGYQNATIWGSGILYGEPEGFIWKRSKNRKLDIRCVRGPKTKARLKENGYDVSKCLFGDPGVLMPLIYKPKEKAKRKYSVVLHMARKKEVKADNQIDIMTDDWKATIDEIYNSELVISSSLHGIILAEAYGVPAIMLDKVEFSDHFKYQDYYLSTGRTEYPCARSVEEALKMDIPKVPDVTELQNNLLKSFPVDLWD